MSRAGRGSEGKPPGPCPEDPGPGGGEDRTPGRTAVVGTSRSVPGQQRGRDAALPEGEGGEDRVGGSSWCGLSLGRAGGLARGGFSSPRAQAGLCPVGGRGPAGSGSQGARPSRGAGLNHTGHVLGGRVSGGPRALWEEAPAPCAPTSRARGRARGRTRRAKDGTAPWRVPASGSWDGGSEGLGGGLP